MTAGLEANLKLCLSLTLGIRLTVDYAPKVRVGEDVGGWTAKDDAIQQVEVGHAQLRPKVFPEIELLAQSDVFIHTPRKAEREDSSCRTKRPETRVGEGGCVKYRQSLVDVVIRELLLHSGYDI